MDFIPYGKQLIDQSDIDAVVETLHSDYLTTGPKVKAFEDALLIIVDVKYTVLQLQMVLLHCIWHLLYC